MRLPPRLLPLVALATAAACAGRAPDDVKAVTERGDAAMVVSVDCEDAAPVGIISLHEAQFSPASLTIAPGDEVRFDNDDVIAHTTSSWEVRRGEVAEQTMFWDEPVPAGTHRCLRFDEPGVFTYLCALHPEDEQGTITVDDGTPTSGADDDGTDLLDLGAGTIGRERALDL